MSPPAPAAGLQCLVLAGGRGTRLGALAARTPKPLLPVAGRPFLDHLIDEVARFGINRFVIVAGHLGEHIAGHLAGGRRARDRRRLDVQAVIEPRPLGTAGGLAFFADRLDDVFLLLNGDTFFDVDLAALARPPLPPGTLMRMAVRHEPDPGRFGTVVLADADGDTGTAVDRRVTAFREKAAAAGPGFVNAGAYLVRKATVGLIEANPCSLETEVMPRLARQGSLQARCLAGRFIDIGVPAELARAQVMFPIRRAAVFFDRDGVLNEDTGYTYRTDDLRWLPGAREAVRRVNASGRFAFVITNQSGIARGYYDEAAVAAFHAEMQRQLAAVGAHIDEFLHCPHHPDGSIHGLATTCACRKPAPGMIHDLMRRWPVIAEGSFVIGDRESDLAAAAAAGIGGKRYIGGDLCALV